LPKSTYSLFRHNLKSKRKHLGLSLQILSERSGISKLLISQIEHNEIKPSIKTASKIAEGLDLPLAELFRKTSKKLVVFHPIDEQFILDIDENNTKNKAPPTSNGLCVDIYHEHLNAGVITDSMSHDDASKFILAMTDDLSITANKTKYSLNKGDSLYIADNVQHSIHNEGDAQANFITMMYRL